MIRSKPSTPPLQTGCRSISVSATLTAQPDGTYLIAGQLDLDYYNQTGVTIDALPMRLYPNYPAYIEGSDDVRRDQVNTVAVTPRRGLDPTLVEIPSPVSVIAGDVYANFDRFETVIPVDPADTYGMFEFDTIGNTLSMAHWLPLITGWDRETGGISNRLTRAATRSSRTPRYSMSTLEAPGELTFATTGSLVETNEATTSATHRWVSGPSRDFVMVASSTFAMETTTINGTIVRSFFLEEDRQSGLQVLDTAVESLRTYGELLGAYPYAEFDLVQARLGSRAAGYRVPRARFHWSGSVRTVQQLPRFHRDP